MRRNEHGTEFYCGIGDWGNGDGLFRRKKQEVAQRPVDEINSVQHMKQPAPGKKAKKDANERESWVAKEMRKEGYDPKNMTGKDYRKLLGAE